MLNLIVNPNAHHRKSRRLIEQVEKALLRAGAEYRIFRPAARGEIGRFARELSEKGPCRIVAVGGDGTLNEVLQGIADPANVELGLIPAGTGNDFAAAARIPRGLAALDLILGGESRYTDYLEFSDGRRSLNIAGLGMDVDILERCERMKHAGSRSKYFFSLLVSLVKYRGVRISVTAEGETREYDALIAALCNGRQLGGGIPLCPDASIEDGLLDLVVIESPKRRRLLLELIKLMRGKILTRPIAHRILCKEASIVPAQEGFAQYDGELARAPRLDARIVSGKLRMFRGGNGESL